MSKHLDVNGTSNLDAVDIDGAVQIDATVLLEWMIQVMM